MCLEAVRRDSTKEQHMVDDAALRPCGRQLNISQPKTNHQAADNCMKVSSHLSKGHVSNPFGADPEGFKFLRARPQNSTVMNVKSSNHAQTREKL